MSYNLNKITLEKCSSGIQSLDEITEGRLPKGRPTLICGSAGCGKTMLGKGSTFYFTIPHQG